MKHASLIRKVRAAARANGLAFELKRQGKRHELWMCGQTVVSIPRHRDINEGTVRGIYEDFEEELGKGWWR